MAIIAGAEIFDVESAAEEDVFANAALTSQCTVEEDAAPRDDDASRARKDAEVGVDGVTRSTGEEDEAAAPI